MRDQPLPTLQSILGVHPGLTIYCTDHRRCGRRSYFPVARLIEMFGPAFPVARVYTRFRCTGCGGSGRKRGEVYYELDLTYHRQRIDEMRRKQNGEG